MTDHYGTPRTSKRVGEPAQVYLTDADQARLDHLTAQLGASKSDVLRRGLEALELQHMEPLAHLTLRCIGLVNDGDEPDAVDAARGHDRLFALSNDASWRAPSDGT